MNFDLLLSFFFLYLLGVTLLVADLIYFVWKKKRNKDYVASPFVMFVLYIACGIICASTRFPIAGNTLIDFLINFVFYILIISTSAKIITTIRRKYRYK